MNARSHHAHREFCRLTLKAKALTRKGEHRAAAFAEDCARQWRKWARYYRRFPSSPREPEVG